MACAIKVVNLFSGVSRSRLKMVPAGSYCRNTQIAPRRCLGRRSLGHHTKSSVVVGVIGVVVVPVARPPVGSVVVPGTRAAQKPTTGTVSVCSLQPGARPPGSKAAVALAHGGRSPSTAIPQIQTPHPPHDSCNCAAGFWETAACDAAATRRNRASSQIMACQAVASNSRHGDCVPAFQRGQRAEVRGQRAEEQRPNRRGITGKEITRPPHENQCSGWCNRGCSSCGSPSARRYR